MRKTGENTSQMKRILAPILLMVLLFPSLAIGETVKFKDLVKTDGLYYKKFTDVPFTGKVTGKYYQETFRNGKKEGLWVTYYENGRLRNKGTYKNGKKDGLWVRYGEYGQLWDKGTYKDGEEDGPWVWYHEDGRRE